MNTNFFNQIAALNITGDLNLIITKGAGNNLVVSITLQNEACGDNAKHLITPFNLKGTPAELDEGFFERITTPLETASGLMDNMEAFIKQLEEAKKQSAIEKEKADKDKKAKETKEKKFKEAMAKETKEKKFKEAMAKAADLEKEGKHRDAWMKVPDPADYPEQAEAIRKRKMELSEKFASPSLFGAE